MWPCVQSTLHDVCLYEISINSHHCYCCEVGDIQGRWARRWGRFPLGRARDGWLTLCVGDMYSGIFFLTLDGDILMHSEASGEGWGLKLYIVGLCTGFLGKRLKMQPSLQTTMTESCSLSQVLELVGSVLSPVTPCYVSYLMLSQAQRPAAFKAGF